MPSKLMFMQVELQNIKRNWVGILAARVACYTIFGGLSAALVGAICIALAGALTGAVIDMQGTPRTWDQGLIPAGCFVGAVLGGAGGGVTGALSFALLGIFNLPDGRLFPRRATFLAVWSGQVCGTLGVCFSFFLMVAMATPWVGKSFPAMVDAHVMWILFGAPALMICGEIAGAVWSFGLKKPAVEVASALPNGAV